MSARNPDDTVFDIPRSVQNRLPDVLNALPDPVWVFDSRDRIVGWNRAAGQMYGLPTEHALGQSVLLFVPHEELLEFARASVAVRRDGVWSGDLTSQTATGTRKLVEARWARLTPEDPDSPIVALHTDVTARRACEDLAERTARWGATRSLAAALTSELPADLPTMKLLQEFGAGPNPLGEVLLRGTGEWILVTSPSPVFRDLTGSLLEGAGYHPVVASDRFHAARLTERYRARLRVALLGLEPHPEEVAMDVRRYHPVLPVIPVGTPDGTPASPGSILEAVALAVAEANLTEAGLLGR